MLPLHSVFISISSNADASQLIFLFVPLTIVFVCRLLLFGDIVKTCACIDCRAVFDCAFTNAENTTYTMRLKECFMVNRFYRGNCGSQS